MQRTMPPAGAVEAPTPPNHARSKSTRTPLSVVHAKALYTESEAIAARADEEAARADEEAAKREAAERRILELEAQLRQAKAQGSNRAASSD